MASAAGLAYNSVRECPLARTKTELPEDHSVTIGGLERIATWRMGGRVVVGNCVRVLQGVGAADLPGHFPLSGWSAADGTRFAMGQ